MVKEEAVETNAEEARILELADQMRLARVDEDFPLAAELSLRIYALRFGNPAQATLEAPDERRTA